MYAVDSSVVAAGIHPPVGPDATAAVVAAAHVDASVAGAYAVAFDAICKSLNMYHLIHQLSSLHLEL